MPSMEDKKQTQAMEEGLENGSTTAEPEIKYRGWKTMPYIVGNETFEKLGALGTIGNLVVYFTTVFHIPSVATATMVNAFNATSNFAPLLGAFLADTYYGRYATIGIGSIASQLGLLFIMLTAAIPNLHPPQCKPGQPCRGPTPGQHAFLLLGLLFLVIGAGGIRPCNLAFGADQFDARTEHGKRGINSFFNLYYFTFNFAMLISATVVVYIQSNVSWSIGLGVPVVFMFFSCVLFFAGSRIYVKVRPEGSPFSSVAQVIVAAFRKRRLKLPEDPKQSLFDPPHSSSLISKLPYSDQFRCLDKAAIAIPKDEIDANGCSANPWRLCTLQEVEQVKCIARIIPIWSTTIIYQVATSQEITYAILQALQSDRRLGRFQIPAGSFTVFPMLAMTIWIPIYDRIIVPRVERITKKEGGITMLQRMGIGHVLAVVAMVVAGVTEARRRSAALSHKSLEISITGSGISPFSALWLIPMLGIMGVSEAFSTVSQVEFYYKQFPENMRSFAGSVVALGFAAGGYLSSLMVMVVNRSTGRRAGEANWLAEDLNKGRLDFFYYTVAALVVLNFVYFIACAKWYRYKV
ncbi:protein NRT1/ PTR FAMILY 2.11-like [Canna indica]|uniref:Protein NRT1/ PTR FAMILY 2.11-like n=1 Tax=Canna indica TaxID=4628 RepID=A0AAQ3KUI4_9LILI|nr:protein NRT1/ PTR FAMILY 2.11-like [Canna indica]